MNRRDSLNALLALGAAVLSPHAAAQKPPPLLGVVQFSSAPDEAGVGLFLKELAALGYIEGKSLRVERRYADEDANRYPVLLGDLARLNPHAVLAAGHDIANAAKATTPALNVVTWGSEDPVLSGLVQSLARPGGRITGVTFMSPQAAPRGSKSSRMQSRDLHACARCGTGRTQTLTTDMDSIAEALGVRLTLITVKRPADLDTIATLATKAAAQAVFVVPSRLTNAPGYVHRIAQTYLLAKLPSMSAYASFANASGLFSYGADIPDLLKRLAAQTVRILSGTSPADLPIEQASRFVFVVNRKTASAIGLKLPEVITMRADRVIE